MNGRKIFTILTTKLEKHSLVFFLIWALWLSFYFLIGPLALVRIHDNGDGILPELLAFKINFLKYGLSSWAQFAGSGLDLFALNLIPFFNSNSLIFLALPGWLAYGIIMLLQRFVASFFMYRLCRDSLHLNPLPSLFAAISYSLFNFFVISLREDFTLYHQLAEPGLPFFLWAFEKLLNIPGIKKNVLNFFLGAFLGFSSSFTLALPFLLPFILIWFVFIRNISSRQLFTSYALFVFGALLIQSPYIFSIILNGPLSHRTTWDFSSPYLGGAHPWESYFNKITNFIAGHKIPFILAILGIVATRFKQKHLNRLFILVILIITISPLYSFVQPILRSYFGFIGGFRFERLVISATFFTIIAGAYGFSYLSGWVVNFYNKSENKKLSIPIYKVTAVLIFLILAIQSFQFNYSSIKTSLSFPYAKIYENLDLKELARANKDKNYRVASVSDDKLHPMYAIAYGLESADGYLVLYSKRYRNFWKEVIRFDKFTHQEAKIPEELFEFVDKLRKFDAWGSRIYLFSPYSEPISPTIPFSDFYNLNLLSLANVKYFLSYYPLSDNQLELLSSSYAKQVESLTAKPLKERTMAVLQGKYFGQPVYIYENKQVLPRFFLVNTFRLFKNDQELLHELSLSTFEELGQTAFVVETDVKEILDELPKEDGEIGNVNEVTPTFYSPGKSTFSINLDQPKILVLINNYSPYWTASINGQEAPIFPVYHTFQGVLLQPGKNDVVVEYKPPYFWNSLLKR